MVQHGDELRHFRIVIAHRQDADVLGLFERGKGCSQFAAKVREIGRVNVSVERVLPRRWRVGQLRGPCQWLSAASADPVP